MSGITLRGISKRYGRRTVLSAVDLTLNEGESLVVQGPNGSGKSTLLRIVAGVSLATSGVIERTLPQVSYLPEHFRPPPLMRADAYLRHVGRMSGLNANAAQSRIDALTGLLEIRPGVHERMGRLSKGNLQKVGLVQVFLGEQRLIVLDEPRTGLEVTRWSVLDDLIRAASRAGSAVISSEHDAGVLEKASKALALPAGTMGRAVPMSRKNRVEIRIQPTDPTRAELENLLAPFGSAEIQIRPTKPANVVVIRVDPAEKHALLIRLLTNGWTVNQLVEDDADA